MKKLLALAAVVFAVGAVKSALDNAKRPRCSGYTVGGRVKDRILEFKIVPITKGTSIESLALAAWANDSYKDFNGATVKDYIEIITNENADPNEIATHGGIAVPTDLTVDILLEDRKRKERFEDRREETVKDVHRDLQAWGLETEAEVLKGNSDLTL